MTMEFAKTAPKTLLQQLIYMTSELPVRIIINITCNISKKIREYTSIKPMLVAIDYGLFYTSQRLHVLGIHTDKFSEETQLCIKNILKFNEKLALCITTCIITASKDIKNELRKKTFIKKIQQGPALLIKLIIKNINKGLCGNKVISKENVNVFFQSLIRYTKFCITISIAFILVPCPILERSKISKFTEKLPAMGYGEVNYIARISFAIAALCVLHLLLGYKEHIIDTYMSAASHFILTAVSAVTFTSMIIAPRDGANKFVIVNIIIAFLLCWFCSPVIFALS
jgi:hypothetical protein